MSLLLSASFSHLVHIRARRGACALTLATPRRRAASCDAIKVNSGSGGPPPDAAGPSGRSSGPPVPPWALMGRMIPADRIALSSEQKQVLLTSAASRLSGLEMDVFDAQLQELLLLLPDLRDRVLSLKPSILVELCADTRGVAIKLIQLRELFPDANVSVIIAKCPTLLTAAEWPGVVAAHGKLTAMFPEGGLGQMVTQQPLLLVEDVDEVVGELERLLPGGPSGRQLLRADPSLLLAVVSNRRLSLWLMPGVDVRIMLLRNPGVVTQYRLERRVGEGTYGVVYRATEVATGQTVAVKEMRPDDSEEGVPSSALREIAILLELRHDNVVRLREVTRDYSGAEAQRSTQLFLVFDFLDLDLHRLMHIYPQLGSNPRLVKYYTYQLLSGLEYCHRRRILHRDLKPQNLLVDLHNRNRIKIADFGLSRAFGVPVRLLSPEVVTLWYRPPELLLGGKLYGTPVDMWSVACVVLELSNRWPLFPGSTEIDTLLKIFEKLGSPDEASWPGLAELPHWRPALPRYRPRPWEEIAPRLDPQGRDLMRRMLVYDPAQRITAAAAMRHPYFEGISELMANPPDLTA